ncbi:MAG: LegC family aminotransferase [Rhodothermia bacterium]|nr:LegC family aminotransferase [Rhodothermia bacterium]
MYSSITSFIRDKFSEHENFIGLHEPRFCGNEKKYLIDAIDSTFVSSVGAYVNRFEQMMCEITKAKYAIATTNGTVALHLALVVAGVTNHDEVITQPLTFVATANAIKHAGGIPVFVDVDKDTMGMSPAFLKEFLENQTERDREGGCINKITKRKIKACLPMHTFGFPCRIAEIKQICSEFGIVLIEDCAESLGSYVGKDHTGNFGLAATFSFNGNKTVTSGGGGAIITNDEDFAKKAKHLSTTAKVPHAWEFYHDEVGYNYRMPNLNAALAVAQLEQLTTFLANKRDLAQSYRLFFETRPETFVWELEGTTANFWLNSIIFENSESKNAFLKFSNERKVMTRPIWTLMDKLPAFKNCQKSTLTNAEYLEKRVVNLPSSFRPS